ncbi:porin family protein [Oceanospirillaceae bacterium]|nr:porin family protein [Oceanospirillaceae bacterium]
MLKTPYIVAVSVALMATAHTAHAQEQEQDKYYAKLGANLSLSPSVKPSGVSKMLAKSGVMPEVTFGFNLDDGLAVELSYQKAGGALKSNSSDDLVFESIIVKAIYQLDVENTAMYNPYVGLGLGNTTTKTSNYSGSSTSVQATLGNRFEFDQDWFGDLSANYTHVGSATLKNSEYTQKIDASSLTSVSFAIGKSF